MHVGGGAPPDRRCVSDRSAAVKFPGAAQGGGQGSGQGSGVVKIVAHRGYWRTRDEQNGAAAFTRALDGGFGIETDLRDMAGEVVISHDPPGTAPGAGIAAPPASLDDFLALCAARRRVGPLALNIKADGLQRQVRAALERAGAYDAYDAYGSGMHDETYGAYVFDMSIPDTLGYLAVGVPVYVRHSDIEPEPVLYAPAAGVWLDQFHSDWADAAVIGRHLDAGKAVCLVSPELHRRDHRRQWESLAAAGLGGRPGFSLCTDFPEEAVRAFDAG
jgi:hypothetical protein